MGTLANITDAEFNTLVRDTEVPLLVDFWAEWCGPCKRIAPVLEEIQSEMGDKIKIVKLNIDENAATPTKFDVMAIPTMILFKNGEMVHRVKGALPKGQLVQELQSAL